MKNMEVDEISKVSECSEQKTSYIMSVDKEEKSELLLNQINKLSTKICLESNTAEAAEQDSSIKVSDFVSDDISTVEIYEPSDDEVNVSEEISELVSNTCDTVQIIVNDESPVVEIYKPPLNEKAVSEEVSKLVSDTCNAVEIIINNNDADGLVVDNNEITLKTVTTGFKGIPKMFETANNDLYDAEMDDDDNDTNNVPASDNNESLTNEDLKNSSELAEHDSSGKISEMNEEEEECSNSFIETDAKNPVRKARHWTEQASLPYYREPKPDFFEYTRKLQEELDPKPSVISSPSLPSGSTHVIVLDDPVESSYQEPDFIKSLTSPGPDRNTKSTTFDLCLEKSNRKSSEKSASGLIILDDYKSPGVKNSHFSRSSDFWNLSTLNSTKENPEPVPGAKYKALKEQLMEKIMLKKEESFNKRKEEQEVDEELFDEEEEIVSDDAPEGSENGSSDEDMEDDSPENADDDEVLKDMLIKECKTFPYNTSRETDDSSVMKNAETEQFHSAIGEDSQEPMECYSLPSYQPGGGFLRSPFQKRNSNRTFSDSDINDSALSSPSQKQSSGRIFSDSDFIDSAPNGSLKFNQLKNTSSLKLKDSSYEQLPFDGGNEQEIIPHWESLTVSEKQGSQLFDEDLSVICSGKFPSTNEDIPWTPSSLKNSLPDNKAAVSPSYSSHANNEPDHLNDSDDDEELVRPAKKIKLSLVEKLWDSEDEDDVGSKDPIVQNGKLKGENHQLLNDDDADHGSEADPEEEDEIDDEYENLQKPVYDLFKESHGKDAEDEESAKKFEIKNFFENEAELSGEEGSSDENEDDVDEYDDEMITDEIVASEEKLRKEVGTIHFKRQQDEDDQMIRQLKEDFLPEGELYNENGQRKRRYIWNNIGMDDNDFTETKSDSEEEEIESLPTDYLKWQQEKNKSNLPEDDVVVQTPKSIGLKVDIVGKVSVTRCSSVSNSSISASPMLRRGSFLNASIGKNVKFMKEFSSSEGSVSRKNFVFSSPRPNASHPSTPVLEVNSLKINTSINNRSIFNKI